MQSILQSKHTKNNDLKQMRTALFPDITTALGPLTQLRQRRVFMIYAGLYIAAICLVFWLPSETLAALGHSLILPGSGFLGGSSLEGGLVPLEIGLVFLNLMALILAAFLWFATGNVILPPCVWVLAALASSLWHVPKKSAEFDPVITALVFSVGPAGIVILTLYRLTALRLGQSRRKRLNVALINLEKTSKPMREATTERDELTLSELQHMRLFLDRALQPVDDFEGFEWLDQFQTAAVRYQINFISYALSMAQANYMPDFTGYLSTAQKNLKAKQENHRIWKYWKLENMWGNLRTGADPIARDNIMYSGFTGAQLAFARRADMRGVAALNGLSCRHTEIEFNYSQDDLIQGLSGQYKQANYGLLPCEPNWVYPLCNAITATAIRAHDTQAGTHYWDDIKNGFRRALEAEYIMPSGRFIPFKSNYTGFAPPPVGGAVMQAFPCFFLNAVLPDIARRQWTALKIDMKGKNWRRALWPADVGNYSFSRASSYGATALAAREMGDNETADLLLGYLEQDCPRVTQNGISHYSKASLWANANAFMARIGKANGLQDLVTQPQNIEGPYLAYVDPYHLMIAKAKAHEGCLTIVVYPAQENSTQRLSLAGLKPHAAYGVKGQGAASFTARSDGTHILNLPINGRTEIYIHPNL